MLTSPEGVRFFIGARAESRELSWAVVSQRSATQRDITVSFHNFESQNFKLSVSNPKSKYVACLSALSQISNCQGLGRKNKHDILKTDRIHGASRR